MSYDISLVDPVTKEQLHSDVAHDMRGGTYQIGGTTELWLNVTGNYSRYYNEATEGDNRFAHEEISGYNKDFTPGPLVTLYGIQGIYGKTGAESIPMIKDMIDRIEQKYKTDNREWVVSRRERKVYFDENGVCMDLHAAIKSGRLNTEKTVEYDISEGDTSNYWTDTAANALRPLHQLIAMARIRPDGIWEGD